MGVVVDSGLSGELTLTVELDSDEITAGRGDVEEELDDIMRRVGGMCIYVDDRRCYMVLCDYDRGCTAATTTRRTAPSGDKHIPGTVGRSEDLNWISSLNEPRTFGAKFCYVRKQNVDTLLSNSPLASNSE